MSAEEIERLKLEDGVRLHESVKVQLGDLCPRDMPARSSSRLCWSSPAIRTHAKKLLHLIQSDNFFRGCVQGQGHTG